MTSRAPCFAILILLITCATTSVAHAQDVLSQPIKVEVGGTPGGGTWLTGGGLLTLGSRNVTRKLGYDPDIDPSQSFGVTNIGAGFNISDAPAFFAKTKSPAGHRIEFGMRYTFRR